MHRSAAEFSAHFNLHPAQPSVWPKSHTQQLRASAVLVPLVETPTGLHVVLTRRTAHLRHHANQICFPGGSRDASDHSLLHTALRETEEELGIQAGNINLLGALPPQPVLTKFMIQPYLGVVPANTAYKVQTNEVAEVFHVPLRTLMDQRNHLQFKREHPIYPVVHFIPYQHYLIWGATAAIIRRLADQMNPAGKHLYRPVF